MAAGRDIIFEYLRELGVEYLFGVPGTNEIPLIDGTSVAENRIEYVPCLHENIAMGAAMGYARASGKPGVVELHVTPGAAHGIGNLFNAYKSHIPLVVLCAQQHNELLTQEPLLGSDLVQVARQYTKWAWEVRYPGELGLVMQRALKEALTPPQRPVFVSIPWEFTLAEVAHAPAHVTQIPTEFGGDPTALQQASRRLAEAHSPVIVAGDGVGAGNAWSELESLAKLLGAPVYLESFSSHMNFPNSSPLWREELPQTQEEMQTVFQEHDVAFLCGYNSQAPVLVYRDETGPLIPASVSQVYLHDDAWEIGKNAFGEVAVLGDIKVSLQAMVKAVPDTPAYDAAAAAARCREIEQADEGLRAELAEHRKALAERPATAAISGEDVAIALAEVQPELRAPLMLSNEAVSDVKFFQRHLSFDRPDAYFLGQGGSLGWSMPAALGMKLAVKDERTVVNVIGDGSALFYPHTWWTARKLELPILYVVTNNREYRTLLLGLKALEKICDWKPKGDPWYLRLDDPPMDLSKLAAPFGVEGERVEASSELADALRRGTAALAAGRPYVVDAVIDPTLTSERPMPRFQAPSAEEDANASELYLGPA